MTKQNDKNLTKKPVSVFPKTFQKWLTWKASELTKDEREKAIEHFQEKRDRMKAQVISLNEEIDRLTSRIQELQLTNKALLIDELMAKEGISISDIKAKLERLKVLEALNAEKPKAPPAPTAPSATATPRPSATPSPSPTAPSVPSTGSTATPSLGGQAKA